MKAKELDKKFDEGKDILKHLDLLKARRPNQEQRRVFANCAVCDEQPCEKIETIS